MTVAGSGLHGVTHRGRAAVVENHIPGVDFSLPLDRGHHRDHPRQGFRQRQSRVLLRNAHRAVLIHRNASGEGMDQGF